MTSPPPVTARRTSTHDVLARGPRHMPGTLVFLGALAIALGVLGEAMNWPISFAIAAALAGVCLLAAAVLAWRDARRRGRSFAGALWDSIREVWHWAWMLWW